MVRERGAGVGERGGVVVSVGRGGRMGVSVVWGEQAERRRVSSKRRRKRGRGFICGVLCQSL